MQPRHLYRAPQALINRILDHQSVRVGKRIAIASIRRSNATPLTLILIILTFISNTIYCTSAQYIEMYDAVKLGHV